MMISNHVMAVKWYVNDNSTTGDVFCTAIGAAGNTGLTPGSPKNTLGAVVLLASNTDTIFIDKGDFNEVNINSPSGINKSLVIMGAGSGNTVFTGNATVNRFASITADNVTIKNLTLRNYYLNGDGQVVTMNGRVGILFENVTVKDNPGAAAAGVNFLLTNSSVTFQGCIFSCSGWNADGGGTIRSSGGTLDVINCTFKEVRNFATSGNGGAIEMTSSPTVVVTNSTFNSCSARRGGAIYQNTGTLTVTGSCFDGNFSAGDGSDPSNGGGAYYSSGGAGTSCSFTNCSFSNNKVNKNGDANASSDGGAFLFRSANGTFSINKCSFSNISTSSYDKGQDFYLDEGGSGLTGSITNSTFSASTNGNGGNKVNIYNSDLEAADVSITNSNTWTFTGTAFTTTDSNAPVWDSGLSAPNTSCTDPTNIAACGASIDCATETVTPIIFSCASDKIITDCSAISDYTPEILAFDDCSFTVSQSPVAGTVLSNGIHTVTFTVTDTHGNTSTCSITVTVSGCVCTPPSAPTGSASQNFCSIDAPTVADLIATGTGTITWFDQPTGGTAYNSTDALVSGNHYYASQTVGSCESATRLDVTVTISDPSSPTGTASQDFCSIDAPTVADLVAAGTGTITWYDQATGGTAYNSSDALVSGNHYYASQTVGSCESATRLDVTVTITDPTAPAVTSSSITECEESPIQTLDANSV
jgi:hypothetical protein